MNCATGVWCRCSRADIDWTDWPPAWRPTSKSCGTNEREVSGLALVAFEVFRFPALQVVGPFASALLRFGDPLGGKVTRERGAHGDVFAATLFRGVGDGDLRPLVGLDPVLGNPLAVVIRDAEVELG